MGQRGCFLGTSQYVVLDMNVTIINSFIKIQDFFSFYEKMTIIFVLVVKKMLCGIIKRTKGTKNEAIKALVGSSQAP